MRVEREWAKRESYSDFEIHHLLGKSAHIIVKAEPIFTRLLGREHKIPLSFLLGVHDDLVPGAHNIVVDIKGTTRLDLEVAKITTR